MYYSLGPQGDATPRVYEGLRKYWQTSFKGRHLAAYDDGVVAGKADLADDSTAGFDALNDVPSEDRDDGWDAKLDGYRDTTRKARGPTPLSNGF